MNLNVGQHDEPGQIHADPVLRVDLCWWRIARLGTYISDEDLAFMNQSVVYEVSTDVVYIKDSDKARVIIEYVKQALAKKRR